jgi:hypothetical protein
VHSPFEAFGGKRARKARRDGSPKKARSYKILLINGDTQVHTAELQRALGILSRR